MKVLFATYPMALHTPGGGEMQLMAYRKHLPQFGVEVTLFDPWNPRFLEHDLVHFFSCVGGSSHFCNFVRNLGLPLVISSSLWITRETSHLYPTAEIKNQLGLADCVITNSVAESLALAEVLELPAQRFEVIPNGVDEIFLSAQQKLSTFPRPVDCPYVLNVANIEPRKNQLLLAEAIKQFPYHKLVLAGYARDPQYLEEILKIGGKHVVYLGPVQSNSNELLALYAHCEVFALPSTLETPGLAALEAQALGKPLIVTSEGCTREYFSSAATYVSALNVAELVNALSSKLRASSKQSVNTKPLSWRQVAEKLAHLYRRYAYQT